MKRTSVGVAASLAAVSAMAGAGAGRAQVVSEIGQGLHETGRAGLDTLGQTYNGIGSVAASPFRDFGVLRTKLPPPLEKARSRPYDVRGLGSCKAVLSEVADLDLVLGPDIDTPNIEHHRSMYVSAADMAGSAAVDAMRSAVDHFIPMHDTIRKLTGAERAQKKLDSAMLAGKVRRGFLKSYGMQHNCAWPAAPASFVSGARRPGVDGGGDAGDPAARADDAGGDRRGDRPGERARRRRAGGQPRARAAGGPVAARAARGHRGAGRGVAYRPLRRCGVAHDRAVAQLRRSRSAGPRPPPAGRGRLGGSW